MTARPRTLRRHIYAGIILALVFAVAGCGAGEPAGPGTLAPLTASGATLEAGGRAFEVRGVNYIHPSNANLSTCSALQFGADGNCPWEIAPIAADFDKLRGLGVNTVRVFLNYYVFGGARAAIEKVAMIRLLMSSFLPRPVVATAGQKGSS